MNSFTYTLTVPEGLHARPAMLLVQQAQRCPCSVRLACGGREANAKSILNIMCLGANQGATITFSCSGPEEAEAAAALESFAKQHL